METNKTALVRLKETLNEIDLVCDDYRLTTLKRTVQSVKNFAGQNKYLDIAVLGQFKAGKSSFLNGFLGCAVLPVGNIPVTSIITRIKYGYEERAIVTFLDGSSKTVSINEIAEYVSELFNPQNIKNVHIVDIELLALKRLQELRLVDTPGMGSVWRHNTETAKDWFPETGGVIFIISAEKPISEQEVSLLNEISLYSTEIVVVITKTDLFREEQIREIETFTQEVLKKNFDRNIPLFRYSTCFNTSQYNNIIEQAILVPLSRNRDENYAKILIHKVGSLISTCLSYLDVSYQASLKRESERNKLKDIIFDHHLNSHYIRQELLLIIGSYKEKTRESFKVYLESFRKDIEKNITEEYQVVFPQWKGNLYTLTRQFEHWLNQALSLELKEILLREEKSFQLLDAVQKHLSFYLKSFREKLSQNVNRALGVKLQAEKWNINIRNFSIPDISISRTFEFHLDLLWFLFPMFIFRGVFQRVFYKCIPYEIEKNLHRLTSNLNEKINKEMDSLMGKSLAYINEELATIELLLSEKPGDINEISKRIASLKSSFQKSK